MKLAALTVCARSSRGEGSNGWESDCEDALGDNANLTRAASYSCHALERMLCSRSTTPWMAIASAWKSSGASSLGCG